MYSLQHYSTPGDKYSGTFRCIIHIHTNHFFCFDSKQYFNQASTRFLSLIFHFFILILIIHVAPGSLLFTRAPILFFSSSLCFAAIFGQLARRRTFRRGSARNRAESARFRADSRGTAAEGPPPSQLPRWAIGSAEELPPRIRANPRGNARTPPGSARIRRTSAKNIFRRTPPNVRRTFGGLPRSPRGSARIRADSAGVRRTFAGRSAESAEKYFWRTSGGSARNRAESARFRADSRESAAEVLPPSQ